MDRHTVNLLILFIGSLLLASLMLSACGTYQPPGADLWLAL